MAHESTGTARCLSRFSRASPHNNLARGTSSKVSTVYVRSWGALLLGVICALATGYVLFEDVVKNGAPFTSNHLLTCVVLAITAAAGHMWWQEVKLLRITGLGLVVIFLVGSGYLVVASGGRNAEVAMTKRHAAHFGNDERARIKPLLDRAEKMLGEAADKIQADCVDGKKGKAHCDGLRTTHAVYSAAVKGHKSDLDKLGPEQEEDGDLKGFARFALAFRAIDAKDRDAAEKDMVERLVVIMPYVKAVLVELATVIFLGVAVGHREVTVTPSATVAASKKPATVTVAPKASSVTVTRTATVTPFPRRATVTVEPEARAMQLLQAGATVAQEDLAELFGCKSRTSRWLKRLEGEGRVTRTTAGRRKLVSLKNISANG